MKLFLLAALTTFTTPAWATLNPELSRGDETISIQIPNRSNEICVIPKHFSLGKYKKKDRKQEQELCSFQVGVNLAACPKDNSTNPGVNFFLPPDGMTVEELTEKNCEVKDAKKEAKYKLSTSCSYSPALLGYYHMSRILGGVGNVPPSVIRTMDLERHILLGEKALTLLKEESIIYKTWSRLLSDLKQGPAYSKKDLLFTDKFDQSYGALSKNPKKESFYSEFFNKGEDRIAAFKERNALYKELKKSNLNVGRDWNPANVQRMVQLRDMADMILLDTILGQQDRFGNVHSLKSYFYIHEGNVDSEKNLEDVPEAARAKAIQVNEMLLKDNECGVAKEHRIKKADLLGGVAHMDSDTYRRLLELEKALGSADIKEFFVKEALFTEKDWSVVSKNIVEAAEQLKTACTAGKLKLDLNLDKHFSNTPDPMGCEL